MPRYSVKVIETRLYKARYYVEADNASEALDKALTGDTVEEFSGRCDAVIARDADGNDVRLED